MTPEEEAVIKAAERWANCHDLFETEDVREALMDAVDALERSRQPKLSWYLRTFTDVRKGDHIRLPGQENSEADVEDIVHRNWDVDPSTSKYESRPLDWADVNVKLSGRSTIAIISTYPVEIELTEEEVRACELLGWENRIRIQRGDEQ